MCWKFVKEIKNTRKKKKSVIEIQSEGGTLLEKPKYKNALARAMNEVNALQEKCYGNIDKIVKKYQKLFVKKIGSKTIQGKTVKKGKTVKQGQVIGHVGSSGRSTGPHLHYEILFNNKQIKNKMNILLMINIYYISI